MSHIIGHNQVGDQRFPRFSGPCKGCGATDYGPSTSGPDYCGSCACGVNPEMSKLRRRNDELFNLYTAAQFAVGLLTGHFPPFNDATKKIAEDFLAARKAEWEAKQQTTN